LLAGLEGLGIGPAFLGGAGREAEATTRRGPTAGHEIPAAIEAIVMRCLEREPSERYADTGELATALERALPS